MLFTGKEQNARWVEHFKEVLYQPNPKEIFGFKLETIQPELDVKTDAITKEEVKEVIKSLKNNKTAGIDQITAELIKEGEDVTTNAMSKLFNQYWTSELVPDEWRKGIIVKLPKTGNLSKCGNWRGITFLSVPGKMLCSIMLKAMDSQLREEQAGFRKD